MSMGFLINSIQNWPFFGWKTHAIQDVACLELLVRDVACLELLVRDVACLELLIRDVACLDKLVVFYNDLWTSACHMWNLTWSEGSTCKHQK
jgi:hypothetical protein